MEDQQPSPGDLTDGTPDADADTDTDTDVDTDTDADADAAAVDTDTDTDTDADEIETEAAPPQRRNWFSRNKTAVVLGTSAAVFVAAGAFGGATVAPYLMDRATVDTKIDIATTAAEAITTLWTYTPDNMESLPDRSAKYLSGDFEEQYRKYVDAIVPANKQAKVTNTTEVVGAAVESLNATEASALVYTNTTSTSPLSKNIPAMRYLSYRLQLKRDGARWLVTKMTTVTSLDLTPQL